MSRSILLIILLTGVLVALGCSSNPANPLTPDKASADLELPFTDPSDEFIGNTLMGSYSMNINVQNMTAEIIPNRESMMHFNITSYLPAPTIQINSFDPSTGIVDIDMTVSNTFDIEGYDLRVIIYTDSIGHRLVNFDSWTGLFDIPGGLPINPFAAFGVENAKRVFPRKSMDTQNMKILLPGANPNVNFAIEASYPLNCDEPYEMSGFTQDVLYSTSGSLANVGITVLDWQGDTNSVQLYAPAITGTALVSFTQSAGNMWELDLVNSTGLGEGTYTGYILAKSIGSGATTLYTEVNIEITAQGGNLDPVGDLTVVTLNRGEFALDAEQITSVDFDWDDVAGAVEYTFQRADGYLGDDWSELDITTSSDYKFLPVGFDLDDDIRFRVIAHAVPGGDPETDSIPSEEVFILFMSSMGDMNDTYENNWIFTRKDPTDGIYLTRWYWSVDGWGQCGIGFYGNNSIAKDTNTWAMAYSHLPFPDLEGMKEAYCDGFISPGANWDPPSLGFCIGTISEIPTPGTECPDFNALNDILDPSYFPYNNPNCEGINTQFGETNQGAYRLTPDFGPPEIWHHIGYYMNDIMEPDRDWVAIGYANGSIPLTPGTS